jgi:hypothetical protein
MRLMRLIVMMMVMMMVMITRTSNLPCRWPCSSWRRLPTTPTSPPRTAKSTQTYSEAGAWRHIARKPICAHASLLTAAEKAARTARCRRSVRHSVCWATPAPIRRCANAATPRQKCARLLTEAGAWFFNFSFVSLLFMIDVLLLLYKM